MSSSIFPSKVRGLAYTVVKTLDNSVMVKEGSNYQSTRIAQNINPRWHWRFEYSVIFDSVLTPNPAFAYSDLQQLLGFIQARYNTFDDFLYFDPDDNSVGPGIITATWQANYPYMLSSIIVDPSSHAQQVVSISGNHRSGFTIPTFNDTGGTTTDAGITWQDLGLPVGTGYPNPQAQLQLVTDGTNWYSPIQRDLGGQFYEDITDLASALTVYDNGTATTNYTIAWGGLNIPNVISTEGLYLQFGYTPTGPVTATFNFYFRVRVEENIQDFEKFVNQLWSMGGEQNVQGKGYLKFMSSPPLLVTSGGNNLGSPSTPLLPVTTPVGQNIAVIYPQKVTFNDGSGPNTVTGLAYAQAGINAFAFTELNRQGLGSGGGNAQFFGYVLPPNIPPGSVTHIYNQENYVTWFLTQGAAGAAVIVSCGGFPVGGQINNLYNSTPPSLGQKSYLTFTFDLMAQWNAAGHPAATFPYNLIKQTVQPFASIQGVYNQIVVMYPALIIYYT